MPGRRAPTVVFAIDAGDSELVSGWIQDGRLPTIARIANEGFFSRIVDPELLNEMGSWVSTFSGVSKLRHGYYHFRKLNAGTYDLVRAIPSCAQNALPFWCYTRESGINCLIVDPPELNAYDGVNGIQIANWGTHKSERLSEPFACRPASLADSIEAKFGPTAKLVTFEAATNDDKDISQFQAGLRRIRNKGTLCRDLSAKEDFDLMVISFHESHTLGHRLWNYQKEYSPPNALTNAISEIYSTIDGEIGTIVDSLPADSNLFLISAYGLNGMYPMEGFTESFLHQLGYQRRRSASEFGADPLTLVRRAVPKKLRSMLSDRLSATAQEQSIASNFKNSTQWDQTRAFSIPSLYTGMIRVNLKGREPQGLVEVEDYAKFLDELESELNKLTDPLTGQPAIRRITRTCEAFACDINHHLPDLFIEWQWSREFIDTLEHPRAVLRQEKQTYHRSSFHTSVGFIIGCGPAVKAPNEFSKISVLDVAPTLLSVLGVAVPSHMNGRNRASRGEPAQTFK